MAVPLQAQIEAEWARRESNRWDGRSSPPDPSQTTMWQYQVTPPLPRAWPPDAAAHVTWHVYASGRNRNLCDAVVVAAPWAFVEMGANLDPVLGILSTEIHQIGWQGFWPLRPDQVADFAVGNDAQSCLLALRAPPDAKQAALIRRFYGIWQAGNGRIVTEIRRFHETFFGWLGAA